MRLLSTVLVVGVLGLWVLTLATLQARRTATDDIAAAAFPLLEKTSDLYAALADADTTASRGFLEEGDPVPARERYDADLAKAEALLAEIAPEAERSPEMAAAVEQLTQALPAYAEYVAAARANERQGLVVGAAYLRMASGVMRDALLPAARTLFIEAAVALDRDDRTGTHPMHLVGLLVAATLLVALAVGAQVALALRTRRTLNLALIGATLAVVVAVGGTTAFLAGQQQALQRARREGSDIVKLLAAGRILVLRAQSDANLALIERGTGEAYLQDYVDMVARLGSLEPPSGLLGAVLRAEAQADLPGGLADVRRSLGDLYELNTRVRTLEDENKIEQSVELALDEQAGAALATDAALEAEIAKAADRFALHASDAGQWFTLASLAASALVLGAAALVVVGFEPRIREYR